MPPPPGESEGNRYFCECKKCAPQGGWDLPRRTWYNHNPGGTRGRLPNLSLAEIDYMINLPLLKFSKRQKQGFHEELAQPRAHIFSQAARSDSVRIE